MRDLVEPHTEGLAQLVAEGPAEAIRLPPVHWSAWRRLGFCLVNIAVAAGIRAGFAVEGAVLR
jgi:hypothetical protein